MNKMKLILITQGITRVIEPLKNSSHDLVGIIESAPRGFKKRGLFRRATSSIKGFIAKKLGKISSLRDYCDHFSIPYFFMKSSKEKGLENWIKHLKPDLIVIFSMSRLLKKNIFSIPPKGTINLHPSFLPDYPGPNPCFWHYYNCDLNPGVTVHYIDEGEDSGDIIKQQKIDISLGIKSSERLDILIGEVGTRLLLESVDLISLGKEKRTPQGKNNNVVRARHLMMEEHLQIIDWKKWPLERIWNLLRGTEQWLNAIDQPTGLYVGQRWIIEHMEKSESMAEFSPGKIYSKGGSFFVACKDGKIFLRREFNLFVFLKYFLGLT